MVLISSILLFALLVGVLSVMGMTLWVRPKAAMDRVAGEIAASENTVKHPALAFREVMRKLGNVMPSSPKDSGMMQRRLMPAGFRQPGALRVFYGSKAASAVMLPLLIGGVMFAFHFNDENTLGYLATAAVAGYL